MGYRTYIGFIPKREYNKIKSLTIEQLNNYYNIVSDEDGLEHKSVYEIVEQLYNFGKYTDFQPPKTSYKSFFKKKCTKLAYKEYDFEVITKEYLAYLIDYYSNKVKGYYSEMLEPFLNEKDKVKSSLFENATHRYNKDYDREIIGNFNNLTEDENVQIMKMFEHIKLMSYEWNHPWFPDKKPYDLTNGDKITTSDKYEYAVFELVRIYKSFDWKRNQLVFYGW
jgi:hypothetical protein